MPRFGLDRTVPLAKCWGVASTPVMVAAANLVEIAALVGDTTRAMALASLMGGQAATVSELAVVAGVAKSTMSEHLARLEAAGLLTSIVHRRFRYYRISSPRVAAMLESMKAVAAIDAPARYRPRSAKDDALIAARTCYDHLAGRLGVALADALTARGLVQLTADGGEVTASGLAFFERQKFDIRASGSQRVFCRPCLDWSERRYHIAGLVGASLCQAAFDRGWLRRVGATRAIEVTRSGKRAFADTFGIDTTRILAPRSSLSPQ